MRRQLFLFVNDKGRCYLCGVPLVMRMNKRQRRQALRKGLMLMTQDHVVPKAKGGTNHISNLRACCEPCNRAKADRYDGPLPPPPPPPPAPKPSKKEAKYAQLRAEIAHLTGASSAG